MCVFNALVISGGANKGYITLGALEYLYKYNYLDNIKVYSGSSIGSLISFFLVLGFTPLELFSSVCKHTNFEISDLNFLNFLKDWSVLKFEKIQKVIDDILFEKFGEKINTKITFLELYLLCNKEFICCSYNVTKKREEYYSKELTPDVSCGTAIRLSMALPIMFEKQTEGGDHYLDGAVFSHLPINLIYKPYTSYERGESEIKVLGINTIRSINSSTTNIIEYLFEIIHTLINMKQTPHNQDKNNCIITIESSTPLNPRISLSTKMNLFYQGYSIAKKKMHIKID